MHAPAKPVDDLRPVPAVGVVCFRADHVLLIRRGTPPKQGEWSLPGGRVEPGEPVRAAALRELKEETGVEAELLGLVDVVDANNVFSVQVAEGALEAHWLVMAYFIGRTDLDAQ